MTFLALDAQKNLFTLQKSQLQFEQSLIMNRTRLITGEMGNYASANDGAELDNDQYYISLQKEEEFLNTRKDSLDTQLQLLDSTIASMKTVVNNNIKSGCTLNLLGG